MRQLLAAALLVSLALPVSADEPQVLDLEVEGDRLVVADWSHNKHVVHWGIVGHYLWLEWGDPEREPDSLSPNMVSVDISDLTITRVVAYPDGTVDVIRQTPEAPEPVEAPKVESVGMVEEFPEIDWWKPILKF